MSLIFLSLYILAVGPKNKQSAHEGALELFSGADVWCNLHYFCEAGPFPGLPGPAMSPKEPKICQTPGAGFIMLSSLRAAPKPHGSDPKMPGAVPTNRHRAMPSAFGPATGRFEHDPKLSNCEIAQPSPEVFNFLCVKNKT